MNRMQIAKSTFISSLKLTAKVTFIYGPPCLAQCSTSIEHTVKGVITLLSTLTVHCPVSSTVGHCPL